MSDNTIQKQGLSSDEAEESRRRYGTNRLTPPKRESLWRRFLGKFADPLIIILLVALVLSFGVAIYLYSSGEEDVEAFLEPLGVLLSILLATGVAFYFEQKGEKEFELLNQVDDDVLYKVYRDGKLGQIAKADIVVGDLVILEAGEEVPADGTLLDSLSLEINESSLTGEPLVAKSHLEDQQEAEATYPSSYLCRGTVVVDGHGTYRIDKVGDATEYGKVFEGARIDSSVTTPLSHQLTKLARLITQLSYAVALLVLIGSAFIYGLRGGFSQFDALDALNFFLSKIMIAVTIIVVAVPEGLPMSVTLSLAYSMRSMMKTGNLVRRLHACETMGAVTVICTDKTGTLTQNKMTIEEVSFLPAYQTGDQPSELLALSMAVNSTAHLQHEGVGQIVLGNPTEGALLFWLHARGIDYAQLRTSSTVLSQLTFSTERKYMATLLRHEGKPLLLVKGAPEIVLRHCSVGEDCLRLYEATLQGYQARAMRTIGFAYAYLTDETEAWREGKLTLNNLNFMGVVGISDPIRPDVPEAIKSCMQAGIQVKIITGDTPGTAKEIGMQIGLWHEGLDESRALIAGTDFAMLSDAEALDRVADICIMSRARPMDKERLVRLLQQRGEVVAVTGDGTNDAPALSRAEVGISMGDGTSVAKEASDITILDNSFRSITNAVMWGRSLYLNIQRFILFQMTINVVACIIVLIGAFLGIDSPLTVTQMLWVNLIMDTFAALALASLPPQPKVMEEAPRKPGESIISPSMARRILGCGIVFVTLLLSLLQYLKHMDVRDLTSLDLSSFAKYLFDINPEGHLLSGYELAVFFCFFVFLQFWNMFNAKAYRSDASAFSGLGQSYYFLGIAGLILVGQILITNFGGNMFRVVPLNLQTYLILLGATSLVLLIPELLRLLRSKK